MNSRITKIIVLIVEERSISLFWKTYIFGHNSSDFELLIWEHGMFWRYSSVGLGHAFIVAALLKEMKISKLKIIPFNFIPLNFIPFNAIICCLFIEQKLSERRTRSIGMCLQLENSDNT